MEKEMRRGAGLIVYGILIPLSTSICQNWDESRPNHELPLTQNRKNRVA